MAHTNLVPGTVLQSTSFGCVRAIINEGIPGTNAYRWRLAKRTRRGTFKGFGFANYSEIDPLSWTILSTPASKS